MRLTWQSLDLNSETLAFRFLLLTTTLCYLVTFQSARCWSDDLERNSEMRYYFFLRCTLEENKTVGTGVKIDLAMAVGDEC